MVQMGGRELPVTYIMGLAALTFLGVLLAATAVGIVDVESLYLWLLGNTFVAIMAFGLVALGGAFVGMLVAFQIFNNREFTPFERAVVDGLDDIRELGEQLEATEARLREEIQVLRERVDDDGASDPDATGSERAEVER